MRVLSYDPVRDFAPVAQLVLVPYVLVVKPGLKASNVRELIAFAKWGKVLEDAGIRAD